MAAPLKKKGMRPPAPDVVIVQVPLGAVDQFRATEQADPARGGMALEELRVGDAFNENGFGHGNVDRAL
jgi:hypothetical protein